MIGETLRMLLSDNRILVNDDFTSKIIIPDKALLIFLTTGKPDPGRVSVRFKIG